MVIGSPSPDEVDDACERVEKRVKRPATTTILAEQEWKASPLHPLYRRHTL